MNKRGQWLKIPIVGAIAILVGVGLWQIRNANQEDTGTLNSSETAATQADRVAVAALGRLEPQGEVIRIGGPVGERIGTLEVRRGTWVEAGEILAYLESYGERLAERDLAASQLADSENQLRAQIQLGQAEISEAASRVQQIERPAAFEIEGQQATVRQLEVELASEQQDLRRFQSLFDERAISEQDLDRQQSVVNQLQEQLSNARSSLIRLEAAMETDMLNAQAQLQAARANNELSRIQVAVDSARRNLELAEARLERTIVRAPQAGRILQVFTYAGEAIASGDGILDMGNTNQMFAVAEVYETDVTLVREGQAAIIVSRNGAFSQELTGQVAEVGWQIAKNDVLDDDPAANADSRVVEVKIQLDESELVSNLTNLQVDVRIDVSSTPSTVGDGDEAVIEDGAAEQRLSSQRTPLPEKATPIDRSPNSVSAPFLTEQSTTVASKTIDWNPQTAALYRFTTTVLSLPSASL